MDARVKSAAEIARELLESADWNVDKAVTAALKRSRSEPYLQEQVLRIGWDNLMRGVGTQQRETLTRRVSAGTDSDNRIRQVMKESVLETWLILGMPLGKCTVEDLRRSINLRKANAETEVKRAEFEKAILKKMKPGKSVADCWNETDIQQLMRTML